MRLSKWISYSVVGAALWSVPVAAVYADSSAATVSGVHEIAAWAARHGMTSAQYQSEFNSFVGQSYALTHVSGYTLNGQARFAAIWDQDAHAAWQARHDLNSDQYQSTFDSLVGQGYRLIDSSGYLDNGVVKFAAIWDKSSSGAWQARHNLTASQYQSTFDSLVSQGYRLQRVNGYNIGNDVRYTAIWEKVNNSPAWVARHGLTAAQYQSAFDSYVAQGYHLVQVSGYSDGGQARYAAIWDKSPVGAWQARHGLSSAQYQSTFDSLLGQGYRLKWVSGYGIGGSDYYAAIWEK